MIEFTPLRRSMRARDINEEHRTATPLELLFDLVYVVAISATASGLHETLAHGHTAAGLGLFMATFFAQWIAWVNYSWFASAYDNDDIIFRGLSFLQMFGSLVMAVGIHHVYEHTSFSVLVIGFIVMRIALILQWIRAASGDPERKKTCYRYAVGLLMAQCLWVACVFFPKNWLVPVFIVLMLLELLVPVWAEKYHKTPWHPHHIAERYSLMVVIVLGESIMGAAKAIAPVIYKDNEWAWDIFPLGIGLLGLAFLLWWLYFSIDWAQILSEFRNNYTIFIFGYGHFAILAALTALGSGMALLADAVKQAPEVENTQAVASVSGALAVSVALVSVGAYLGMIALLRHFLLPGAQKNLAAFVLATSILGLTALVIYCGVALSYTAWAIMLAPLGMLLFYRRDDKRLFYRSDKNSTAPEEQP